MTATIERRTEARVHRVAEIFGPTIQGEGALIGRPTIFVRFGGCDYRCSWCDSPHAVDPVHRPTWAQRSDDDILGEITERAGGSPYLVTLSGGNPALQPCGNLIDRGHQRGFTFACETQGSFWPAWFSKLDYLVLSPKPPSSGEAHRFNAEQFAHGLRDVAPIGPGVVSIKVVIFDDADLEWAAQFRTGYTQAALYLSVGNPHIGPYDDPSTAQTLHRQELLDAYRWLAGRVLELGWSDVIVTPQLHVLAWGNKRGI